MSTRKDLLNLKLGKPNWRIALVVTVLTIAGGLFVYWQYPNFYLHPAAQLYSWGARISALLGNKEIAYFNANRAAVLDQTNIEYLNKRCWYGSLAGEVEQVIGDCQRVVEAWPSSVSAHCGLGVALVFRGDYQGAIKELQYYVDQAGQNHHADSFIQEHKQWIALMETGRPPFDDKTIRKLLVH